jgi:hypothetical protein
MELNLTSAQKLQALESSRVALSHELYNLLLRMNLDPDTFEEEDLADIVDPAIDGELLRLRKLLASFETVKAKIQSLS